MARGQGDPHSATNREDERARGLARPLGPNKVRRGREKETCLILRIILYLSLVVEVMAATMATLAGALQGLAVSSSASSSFMTGGDSAMAAASSSGRVPIQQQQQQLGLTIEAAHKKGAGSTKNGRDSNPKMLGVKIYGDQPAQPGAIIIRQRGTKFHPGKNVGLGRDYTIYSLIDGLVKFEKYGPDRKKVSVYPVLEEKVANPNNRRVKRREAFREKREKKKAFQLSRVFSDAGFQLVGQLASVPEGDEESEATALA